MVLLVVDECGIAQLFVKAQPHGLLQIAQVLKALGGDVFVHEFLHFILGDAVPQKAIQFVVNGFLWPVPARFETLVAKLVLLTLRERPTLALTFETVPPPSVVW